ncbi:MAG: TrmB family transcriptional regulator [Candidatus Neomarinimicrobiota bacterium]|nr:MAG: TrmB family transcriptional regulator [Candidatus Neomarinimicrobiota bacterium]
MSNAEKQIVEVLQEFGLSTNASRAYVALLRNNPATGYEISTQSGIPRSAIYSVLNRLSAMGLINSVGDSPKRYVALSPSALLEHLRSSQEDRLKQLEEALDQMDTSEEAFDFWHLHGYRNLLLKLKETIVEARQKLFLSAWAREVEVLDKVLEEAEQRGVEITLFTFCRLRKTFGETVSYDLDERELRKIWNPKIILVTDHTTTVMGSSANRPDSRAIWTRNRAITEIATNHIILDITLAGQRLHFDPNPIVQRVMKRPDIHLDALLETT